jgi:hypothetical protein
MAAATVRTHEFEGLHEIDSLSPERTRPPLFLKISRSSRRRLRAAAAARGMARIRVRGVGLLQDAAVDEQHLVPDLNTVVTDRDDAL